VNTLQVVPNDLDDHLNLLLVPRWFSFIVTVGFFCGSFFFIVYYTITGISGATEAFYMSLDGSDEYQLCYEVPAVLTGTYIADKNGYWNTESKFDESLAVYQLDFIGTEVTQEQYTATMTAFEDSVKYLGEKSAVRDLSWNLMAWSTANLENANGMSMFTLADAHTIFEGLEVVSYTTYGYQGECTPAPYLGSVAQPNTPTYQMQGGSGGLSPDNRYITFKYDMALLDGGERSAAFAKANDPMFDKEFSMCHSHFNPVDTWTYSENEWESSNYYDTSLDVSVDIRSVLTAIAVNFGVIVEGDLQEVKKDATDLFKHWLKNDAEFPPFKYYIDPFYAPMEPIACVPIGSAGYATETQIKGSTSTLTEHMFCLVPVNGNFIYPAIWSKSDRRYSSRSYCQCPRLQSGGAATDSEKTFCHAPYFQIAAVYDKADMYKKRTVKQNSGAITWPVFKLGAKYAAYMKDDRMLGDARIMDELQGILKQPESAGTHSGKLKVFHELSAPNTGLCPNNDCGAGVWTVHPARNSMESTYLTKSNLQLKDLALNTWTDSFAYAKAKKVACENTIYDPQAAGWARMKGTSPVKLVEPFYVCSTTFKQALADSLGNASGTAQLYMTLFMLCVVLVFKRVANCFRPKDRHFRHPRVQSIYDDEQQEIQQAKLAKAFKKLLELGKYNVDEHEFKDFLEDYESRMDDHHFNKELDQHGAMKAESAKKNLEVDVSAATPTTNKSMQLEDF